MQTAFHTRLKRKKQPLAGKPAAFSSHHSASTPQTRVPCTLPAASQLWSVAGGHLARLKRKKQPLAGKPAVAVSFLLGCSGFSRTGSERSRDLPCYQRCTTGIQCLRRLLPHHLLPWSEGRSLLHPLLQEPE